MASLVAPHVAGKTVLLVVGASERGEKEKEKKKKKKTRIERKETKR